MSFFPSSEEAEAALGAGVAAIVVLAPQPETRVVGPAETVRALLNQQRKPNLIVVVDTAPQWALRERELTPSRVELAEVAQGENPDEVPIVTLTAPGASTFGQAISQVLAQTANLADFDWLWLLHDDMVAAPSALERLLEAGVGSRNIGAIGPKQVRYGQPDHLLEMGIDATSTARRVYTIEPDETDQGQHDGREEVLALGSGGALVRRDLFVELGGFDPQLGPFGDGLEFGRRLWLSGNRVIVAPGAVVEHAQSSYGHDTKGRSSFSARRRAQLYNWGLAVPTWQFIPYLLWLPLLTLGRGFARLFSRTPALAFSEIAAYLSLIASLPALVRRRSYLRRIAKVPRSTLKELEAPPALILKTRRSHRKIASRGHDVEVSLDEGALTLLRRHRMRAATTFWALIGVATLVSLLVWYPYAQGIHGGSWGALPTRWQTLVAQGWSGWQVSGDGAPGPASPLLAALSIVSAPFSLLGINPARLAQFTLFAALPLAAWGGWGVASSFTRSNLVRLAVGALWAASGVLALSMMWGNLGALIVFLALPGVLVGLVRGLMPPVLLRARGVEDVTAVPNPPKSVWIGFAGLCSALVVAAAPVMLVVFPAVALALGGKDRRSSEGVRQVGTASRLGAATAVFLPGLTLVLPALVGRIIQGTPADFAAWLSQPALPLTGLGAVVGMPGPLPVSNTGIDAAAGAGGFTLPLLILGTLPGVVLLAWASLRMVHSLITRAEDATFATTSWVLSVVFLALSALQAGLLPGVGEASAALLACAGLSLLVSVTSTYRAYSLSTPGLVEVRDSAARWGRGLPSTLGLAAALASTVALLVLGPIGVFAATNLAARAPSTAASTQDNVALKGLAARNQTGQDQQEQAGVADAEGLRSLYITRAPNPVIPMIAQEAQNGPRAARLLTLSVTTDGEVQARVMRAAGPQLADLAILGAPTIGGESQRVAQNSLLETVATMISRPDPEVAGALADHAVDLVMLQATSAEFLEVQNVLDATVGLEKIGSVEGSELWRVRPDQVAPARVSIHGEEGIQVVDSGAAWVNTQVETAGGTLVLSEVADPAWKATFAGTPLEVAEGPAGEGDWRQAFTLPAGEGALQVRYEPGYLRWWWGASALILGITTLLALPRSVRTRSLVPTLVPNQVGEDHE